MSEDDLQADRKRRAQQFWWFDRQTAVALAKTILATNDDPDPFHLRVLPGVGAEGQPTIWFRLYDGASPGTRDGTKESSPCSPPLNQSKPCPPFCNGDG